MIFFSQLVHMTALLNVVISKNIIAIEWFINRTIRRLSKKLPVEGQFVIFAKHLPLIF